MDFDSLKDKAKDFAEDKLKERFGGGGDRGQDQERQQAPGQDQQQEQQFGEQSPDEEQQNW